jgi:hypothetical protein
MRTHIFILLACLVAMLLAGCSGGDNALTSGDSSGIAAATGRATFTVKWPETTRLIPQAADFIVVTIARSPDGDDIIAERWLPRPEEGGMTTVEISPLPVGALYAKAEAKAWSADWNLLVLAEGVGTLNIGAGQTTPLSITMNSTIATLEINGNSVVGVDQQQTLTVSAYDDGQNLLLLTPGQLQWTQTNGDAASLVPSTSELTATVTGVAAGATDITVKDLESNVTSAPFTITVNAGQNETLEVLFPQPAAVSMDSLATSVVAPPSPVVDLNPLTLRLLSGLPMSKDVGATFNISTPGAVAGDLGLQAINNELGTTNNATLAAGANTLDLNGGTLTFGGQTLAAMSVSEFTVNFTVNANGTWTLPSSCNLELQDNGQGQYVLTGNRMVLSWTGPGVVAPNDVTINCLLYNADGVPLLALTRTTVVVNNMATLDLSASGDGINFNRVSITLDVN